MPEFADYEISLEKRIRIRFRRLDDRFAQSGLYLIPARKPVPSAFKVPKRNAEKQKGWRGHAPALTRRNRPQPTVASSKASSYAATAKPSSAGCHAADRFNASNPMACRIIAVSNTRARTFAKPR